MEETAPLWPSQIATGLNSENDPKAQGFLEPAATRETKEHSFVLEKFLLHGDGMDSLVSSLPLLRPHG